MFISCWVFVFLLHCAQLVLRVRHGRPFFSLLLSFVTSLIVRPLLSFYLSHRSFCISYFVFLGCSFILFHYLRYNLPLPLSTRAIRAERKCQPSWLIFLSRRSDPFFVLFLYYRLRIHNFTWEFNSFRTQNILLKYRTPIFDTLHCCNDADFIYTKFSSIWFRACAKRKTFTN